MYGKPKSIMIDGKIYFDNYIVVKESNSFYAVYQRFSRYSIGYYKNCLVTHGTTLKDACKKARLLQIGYDSALFDME